MLNEKGQTLAQATSDAQGHVKLETDKDAAILLARKDGQTTLLDLKLPALDLAEFDIAGHRDTANSSLCSVRAISIVPVKR